MGAGKAGLKEGVSKRHHGPVPTPAVQQYSGYTAGEGGGGGFQAKQVDGIVLSRNARHTWLIMPSKSDSHHASEALCRSIGLGSIAPPPLQPLPHSAVAAGAFASRAHNPAYFCVVPPSGRSEGARNCMPTGPQGTKLTPDGGPPGGGSGGKPNGYIAQQPAACTTFPLLFYSVALTASPVVAFRLYNCCPAGPQLARHRGSPPRQRQLEESHRACGVSIHCTPHGLRQSRRRRHDRRPSG